MPAPIRVIIVEDDTAMREEFERMVLAQPGLELVGSAQSIAQACALLAATAPPPDVALIDLGLPDGDGVALIAQAVRDMPRLAVLVATIFGDEAHVIRAIEAGAHGYLLKDTSIEEFSRALGLVFEGGSPLSPQIARHLLKRFLPAERKPVPAGEQALTGREIDILTRISYGFTVAETAQQMHISAHTVATHIKNIYGKLAVHNRVEAVNQARRRGLIL
ncbi:response regulator transcription factor [Verticiella sediminum]|uniref:Response regulator transcription factor n=1 Tax=Verticiella sediminum TaxID=1247510 RepID=A0A556AKI9_9BURK|nr:response regulator transcription factor [Verticiella sediminum]TSH93401.1 response regulator transcription factor [Verticiella sediminum]